MDCADVVRALRRDQIVVLHAVPAGTGASSRALIVVFLEASYGQAQEARRCLRNLPGIDDVSFARHTKAIMYVSVSEAADRAPGPGR